MKKDPYAPIRDQLAEPPRHWRSIEHQQMDAAVMEDLEVEMPSRPNVASAGFSRREALKMSGGALALAGLAGCDILRRPEEEILPFTRMPEQVVPGVPLHYATAMPRGTGAVGLVVEANDGRPTKIEGNPHHPSSLGGSDVWAQAEVLKLYDPDRARSPLKGGSAVSWQAFDDFATDHFAKLRAAQGRGLAVLVQDAESPTLRRLLTSAVSRLPQARVFHHDPVHPSNALRGAAVAYGRPVHVSYDLKKANIVFALDSNFLTEGPESLRLAREFGQRRTIHSAREAAGMNRLYVAEGVFSNTGANADHRLQLPSGQMVDLLKALGQELQARHGLHLASVARALNATAPAGAEKFVTVLAKDLARNRGAVAILVGERQPPAVHALALAINEALDAPVTLRAPKEEAPAHGSLSDLTALINQGSVETLVILEANPVYTAPGGLGFPDALKKVPVVLHTGVLPEETGVAAAWHVPSTHFLESWGDARAWDGTASIVQPLILPIFGSRSPLSLLAALAGESEQSDRKLVEATWRSAGEPLAGLKEWRRALHEGLIPETAYPSEALRVQGDAVLRAAEPLHGVAPSKDAVELAVTVGHVLDGRMANSTWLQELPDSMSKLCWDNAVVVSPALAKELGILSHVKKNGYEADIVELSAGGRSVQLPAFVLPGLARYTVAVNAGYGKAWGQTAKGVGTAINPLLPKEAQVLQGVKLSRTGATAGLCSTQDHFSVPGNPFKEMTFAEMSGHQGKDYSLGLGERALFLSGTVAEYTRKGAEFARRGDVPEESVAEKAVLGGPVHPEQLTDEIKYEGQQWGMAVDLTSCIGCNACAVACVAENNVAVVGREQVLLGREMHWMRIDRYFSGDVDNPEAMHQPVACQQCENAPCEPVCPVGATVHDDEGLNAMAYNRCIGTRYCQNNCPFKVRRFNYLDYTGTGIFHVAAAKAQQMNTLKLQRNPNVTVRYRGVMEKCTYCTQRVEEAKIAAKRDGHDRKALPDGAVTPACAQACPTQAITFGNINDTAARVTRVKQSDRNYEMLQELNVRPRTTYLARLQNKNEELG